MYLKLEDIQRFSAYSANMPAQLQAVLFEKAKLLAERLKKYVISNKLSGQVLHKKSGALQRSLQVKVTKTSHKVIGTLSTRSPYGRMFEKGGRVPAHIITPSDAKALMWMKAGEKHFAKEVLHPGYQVKPKRFMAQSLHEMSVQISTEMKLAALKVAKGER